MFMILGATQFDNTLTSQMQVSGRVPAVDLASPVTGGLIFCLKPPAPQTLEFGSTPSK